jgi:predicted DCC family thiol-disulfide oxidoreductase YuxK
MEGKQGGVRVYYDGTCKLCTVAAEGISDSSRAEEFSLSPVSAGLPEGISYGDAMRDVHVVDAEGRVHRGADGVLFILERYRGWKTFVRIARLPGIYLCVRGLYRLVEKTRYWIFGRVVP